MRRQSGTRIPVAKYLSEGWKQQPCAACGGRGIGYAYHDRDPRKPISGMEMCKSCGGRGSVWTSPQGRRAAYPGGPWLAG